MGTKGTDVLDVFSLFHGENIEEKEEKAPDIETLINSYLSITTSNELTTKRSTPYFRASSINSELCLRYECLIRSKFLPNIDITPFNFDPEAKKAVENGTHYHDRYQNMYLGPAGKLYGKWSCPNKLCKGSGIVKTGLLPDLGLTCEFCWENKKYVEPTLSFPGYNLKGHCDGFIFHEGKYFLFDLKTVYVHAFRHIIEPYPKHVDQLMLYAHAIKRGWCDTPVDISGILVLYVIPRDSKQYSIKYDPALAERLLGSVQVMNDYLMKEEAGAVLPPRCECCSVTKPRVTYGKKCPLHNICYKCETSQDLKNVSI